MRTWPSLLVLGLFAVLLLPHLWAASAVYGGQVDHWSRARWDSAGLAPDPGATPAPVIQVYAARAWGWKGVFGVHSWLVMKRAGADAYDRYEVVGWGVRRGAPAIRRGMRVVDGYWAGNRPELLLDRRGAEVAALIDRVEAAIAAYPYPDRYRTWPGPNSNTFIASIARSVPELGLELPPTAVGKDYLNNGSVFGRTPSGTGFQVSLLGLAGISVGLAEGLELNLLGLTIGVDPQNLALKLPGIGRVGLL
jgi:hypothetical protein